MNFEKLRGRENYDTWKIATKSYLTIKNLWSVIEKESSPDDSPETNARAISELILLVEQSLYSYIEDSKSASVVWKSLERAFDDSGVSRKITILNHLVSVKLIQYKSMEKYINTILLYWGKTKIAGFNLEEQVIASLMLGGLPEEYRAMILGIENSGHELTVDYVKNILLQGIPDPFTEGEDKAMPLIEFKGSSKKWKKGWKGKMRCFKCGDTLHVIMNCPKKNLKCHQCGDVNHLVASCPVRRKKRIQPRRGPIPDANVEKTMIVFFSNNGCDVMKNDWYIDSGATGHVCNDKSYFENYLEERTGKEILVANSSKVRVHGSGTVRLNIGGQAVVLKKVNHVPAMCTNLISVRRVTESGFDVLFTQGRCRILDNNKAVIIEGRLLDGMYKVKTNSGMEFVCLSKNMGDSEKWHQKLGHPGYSSMKFLESNDEKVVMPNEKCKVCVMGKQTRETYPAIGNRSFEQLDLIHTDVNGPMPTASLGGHRYFVSFIDDYSKKVFIYPMKLKSEVYARMVEFKNLVENQLGRKIKAVRSDNGTEFVNKQMDELFKSSGIIHQRTIPYTPQQNGVVERYNRTIMEKVRCMLIDAKLGDEFWAEAAHTAVFLLNMIPKAKDAKSANKLWNGEIVDLRKLHIFGEAALILIPKEKRKKLDEKSDEGIFIGYEPNGYRFYNKASKKVVIAKDVVFIDKMDAEKRERVDKCMAARQERQVMQHYGTTVIPYTYEEAMISSEAEKWKEAMKNEYDSLMENGTWVMADLPPEKRAIKCKWVFTTKEGVDGEIIRYKARLVGKGYSQIEGIDYQETYAPVIRYNSIRMLIAIAAHMELKISQMDAVTAFLNGKLTEEIYMEQPQHFEDGTKRSCKLIKSIYGLKQSSRVWNETLNETLIEFGLTRSAVDQCLYYRIADGKILIVAIYVDDILIFSNQDDQEKGVKEALKSKFKMKDMGEVSSILGIRVIRDKECGLITLDQTAYAKRILKRFNMENCNAVASPLDPAQKISKEMCAKGDAEKRIMSDVPYRQAIGSLMFLAQTTRPDISFAVNLLSRYCENPGPGHWGAVKRVLRYIKGTTEYRLKYGSSNDDALIGFSDSDWAADLDERRSTTGYVFTLYGGAISWMCKRQPTVALSSTEAEYMATVATIQEAVWLKLLHNQMFEGWPVTRIMCDNKGAIMTLNNNSYSSRTKHIDIKIKFIREHLENKSVELEYLPTADMPADILTKNVSAAKIMGHLPNFGLFNSTE